MNSNYQESLNTLKFGMNAGAVKNQIKANEKLKLDENVIRKEMLENHLKEIEELKVNKFIIIFIPGIREKNDS